MNIYESQGRTRNFSQRKICIFLCGFNVQKGVTFLPLTGGEKNRLPLNGPNHSIILGGKKRIFRILIKYDEFLQSLIK